MDGVIDKMPLLLDMHTRYIINRGPLLLDLHAHSRTSSRLCDPIHSCDPFGLASAFYPTPYTSVACGHLNWRKNISFTCYSSMYISILIMGVINMQIHFIHQPIVHMYACDIQWALHYYHIHHPYDACYLDVACIIAGISPDRFPGASITN